MEVIEMLDEYSNIYNELVDKKNLATTYTESLNKLKSDITELENESARIQQNIAIEMVNNGIVEEDYKDFKIKPKKLPDLAVIEIKDEIPKSFIDKETVEKIKINKTKIKEVLKRGDDVKGAYLIENRYSLTFKTTKI
jgi:tRNA G37 N-methylase Trm5